MSPGKPFISGSKGQRSGHKNIAGVVKKYTCEESLDQMWKYPDIKRSSLVASIDVDPP